MKIVGIHFGNSSVSASYISGADTGVKQLKLINTTIGFGIEQWVLPTSLYQYKDVHGNFAYSLDKPLAPHTLLSERKKPISYMYETDKEHYRAFIRLVYQRLLDCNQELSNNDFDLAITCPAKWLDYQKKEYKEFFEEALGLYGRRIYLIDDIDAVFFAKYKKEDQHKNVLVVDYGSSTIDFTLVSHGKKVDLDEMSSSNLGASTIEYAIFATYAAAKDSNYNSVHQAIEPILKQKGIDYIDFDRIILDQIREKKERAFTKRDPYIEQFRVSPAQITGLEELHGRQNVFAYELEEPFLEIPQIKEYITNVKKVFATLKERTDNDGGLDKVIISGGACRMLWVRDAIIEIFGIENIETDMTPEFTKSEGLCKYCNLRYGLYF